METAVGRADREKEPNTEKADWKITSRKTFERGGKMGPLGSRVDREVQGEQLPAHPLKAMGG